MLVLQYTFKPRCCLDAISIRRLTKRRSSERESEHGNRRTTAAPTTSPKSVCGAAKTRTSAILGWRRSACCHRINGIGWVNYKSIVCNIAQLPSEGVRLQGTTSGSELCSSHAASATCLERQQGSTAYLDGKRRDLLAAAIDDLLESAAQIEVAVRIHGTLVARPQPSPTLIALERLRHVEGLCAGAAIRSRPGGRLDVSRRVRNGLFARLERDWRNGWAATRLCRRGTTPACTLECRARTTTAERRCVARRSKWPTRGSSDGATAEITSMFGSCFMWSRSSYPTVTHAPRTHTSPSSPCCSGSPLSSQMRMSGPAAGPTLASLRASPNGLAAIGMLSVIA